ncbi:hypothetical protein JW859_02460 [bacterium]|nr:hypothetical protein [bacterium]
MPYLPEKTATIFISTGELSGEMHGAYLVSAIQQLRQEQGLPPAIIEGNGSQRMSEAGVQLLFDVATWGEMGIIANLLKAQFFLRVVSATARFILSNQPDIVVLVDSRFLNISLAKHLRQRGYTGKIVYYVAPVRWQSLYDPADHERSLHNKRFSEIRQYCDFAIPIYPVSLKAYEELDIPFEYVGHPLCEHAKPKLSDAEFANLVGFDYNRAQPPVIVGALPGSRVGEIRQIAPQVFTALAWMTEAFREDRTMPPLHAISVLAHDELLDEVLAAARRAGLQDLTLISPEYVYDLMSRAKVMIVKSGTGTHECLVMGVPAIMCYRVAPYMAWVARYLMRFSMPYYSFPNLLANRPVIPELIQEDCDPSRIVDLAGALLYEKGERQAMLEAFAELRQMICKPSPVRRAAQLVLGQLEDSAN